MESACALFARARRSPNSTRFPARKKFKRNAETAEKVAHTGLKALAAGKSYVISGLGNYLGAHGERLVRRRFVTRIAGGMFKPEKK
jgi:short-subunit dehydrogenase